jgi:hypothetical protein
LADGGEAPDIHLVLPARRVPATLTVQVLGPGGGPSASAIVTLENPAGVQRWYSNEKMSDEGFIEIPVHVGEQYLIRAFVFGSPRQRRSSTYDFLEGTASVKISQPRTTAPVYLLPRSFDGKR